MQSLLIFLAVCTLCLPAFSQESNLQFEQLTVEDGLADNLVHDIFMDSKGYIWFCTQDGLSRYDGVSFKNFRQILGDTTSLNGRISMDIKEDKDGILWIAMLGGGLNRFDPVTEKFKSYPLPKGKNSFSSGKSASKVLVDSDNQVWVGTYDIGFNLLYKETGRFEHFELNKWRASNLNEAFLKNSANDLLEDKGDKNIIWIAGNNGLYRFNKQKKLVDRIPLWVHGQLDTVSSFRCLFMERPGELWAGTWTQGLTRYSTMTRQWTFFPHNPAEWAKGNVSANIVFDIKRKSPTEFWLASKDEGLMSFDLPSQKFAHHTGSSVDSRTHLSTNTDKVYKDKDGRIWVASYQKGVSKLDPANQFFSITPIKPAIGSPANSPFESYDAALDIARDQLYVTTIGSGSLQVFDKKPNEQPKFLYSKLITLDQSSRLNLCIDAKKRVWLAGIPQLWNSAFTLYLFDPDTRQLKPFEHPMLSQVPVHQYFINDVLEDREHNTWFATSFGGLIKLEAGNGKLLQYAKSPAHPDYPASHVRILEIKEDSKGFIWLCAVDNGLFKFDPRTETMMHYTVFSMNGHSVSDERICTVEEDPNGLIWVGTEWNGLWLLDPAKPNDQNMKHYGTEDGLTGSKVAKVVKDKLGTIWLRTSQGLCSYDKSRDEFQAYGGKASSNFSTLGAEGMVLLENGDLFVGSDSRFISFNPGKDVQKSKPPTIVFTDFQVNNKPVFFEKNLNYSDGITLDYKDNFFSIGFSALNFSDPELVQFAYKLEGYDQDWNYLSKGLSKAVYTKVGEGSYTLTVKAANNNGVWNEKGISLKITVRPPWYRSWLAYLFYVLALGTALYSVRAYQIKRLLEKADNLRLQEIDTLKTKLYTNITHEFRTPLTVIMGMAEQLSDEGGKWAENGQNKESLLTKIQEHTGFILRNAGNLLRLINQMLDLSKLDSGKMSLQWELGNAVLFLQYLAESFHSYAATKDIRMTFYPEVKSVEMDFDRQKMQEVVSNLLSNALKFTPSGGKIIFHVSEIPANAASVHPLLQLKISDTGIGIAPADLGNVFDRFYQVDDTNTRKNEGSGIGLALTKDLVELMGGSISVKSETGKGAEFMVLLPITKTAARRHDFPLAEKPMPALQGKAPVLTLPDLQAHAVENTDLPLLLLIEDNADVATYIRSCLRGRYAVEWAENGATGIERALETIPDIIISDVMMPEKDGYEVCQTLKNDERTSHVPIVLLTAKADVQSRLEGLGVGADAYLSKPFLKEELFIRLKKLVELRRRLQQKYAGRDFIALATEASPTAPAMPSPDDAFLKRATSLILDHLDEAEFGNEELAQKMNMSESSLNRKMKALTDKTLSLFIRSVRLQQGKILLQTTDKNISEIAYAVGFTDPAYFSRIFSQEFGAAPSKFYN